MTAAAATAFQYGMPYSTNITHSTIPTTTNHTANHVIDRLTSTNANSCTEYACVCGKVFATSHEFNCHNRSCSNFGAGFACGCGKVFDKLQGVQGHKVQCPAFGHDSSLSECYWFPRLLGLEAGHTCGPIACLSGVHSRTLASAKSVTLLKASCKDPLGAGNSSLMGAAAATAVPNNAADVNNSKSMVAEAQPQLDQ
jgi:hypothetical protein